MEEKFIFGDKEEKRMGSKREGVKEKHKVMIFLIKKKSAKEQVSGWI